MRKYLVLFGILLSTAGSFAQQANFMVVKPEVYQQHIQGEHVQLIDVRTAKEYEEGHINGAENIDFLKDDFLLEFEKFNKEKPIYIYCRSGNRSGKAAVQLSKMGFSNIVDLEGGYNAWKKKE